MAGYPSGKRALDLAVAFGLVLLLAPVFALVVLAMGLDAALVRRDRGPWLYRERRVSQGREFDLLKFRTLRRAVLERAAGDEAHARVHERESGSLTWAGRRLLKPWYLDELPQLLNVLRGDMSIVGPRPWPPSMVAAQLAEGLTYRNEVVAGWTGPAQVHKGVTESSGYSELDLEYVSRCRSASALGLVRLDLSYLWRIVRVMAIGEGLRF